MNPRIGIDLDNTIISYDDGLHAEAVRRGLISLQTPVRKEAVRDAIRAGHGNGPWVELQAHAYSSGMDSARFMEGFSEFFSWAGGARIPLFVISHKTRRSAFGNVDLHGPAIRWMESRGFFSREGMGLALNEQVFLEETREGKCARIAAIRPTHFIDDLAEFLTDPSFPEGPQRIHLCGGGEPCRDPRVMSAPNWNAILQYFKKVTS